MQSQGLDTNGSHPCSPSPEFSATLGTILRERACSPVLRASLSEWRARFQRDLAKPDLRFVIWMATRRCNLRCRYCLLPSEESGGPDLSTDEVKHVFDEIAHHFDASRIMVGITGGEATLRHDLVEIVRHQVSLGFRTVAVDSNGLNYGKHPDLFDRLVEAGMRSPTISVDGIGTAQGALRCDPDQGLLAWRAIEYAQKRYPTLNTTTICVGSRLNLAEIPEVFRRFENAGVAFARLSPVFPIGRAAKQPGMVLSPTDLHRVLSWVAEQRTLFANGTRDLEIEFVDDGWCGLRWEGGLLRASFMYCRAGLTVMGIEHDGRIVGCPVIPKPFNVQGNVRTDSVAKVWREGFAKFRDRSWLRRGACVECAEWSGCFGGSMHNRDEDGTLLRCTSRILNQTDC